VVFPHWTFPTARKRVNGETRPHDCGPGLEKPDGY